MTLGPMEGEPVEPERMVEFIADDDGQYEVEARHRVNKEYEDSVLEAILPLAMTDAEPAMRFELEQKGKETRLYARGNFPVSGAAQDNQMMRPGEWEEDDFDLDPEVSERIDYDEVRDIARYYLNRYDTLGPGIGPKPVTVSIEGNTGTGIEDVGDALEPGES